MKKTIIINSIILDTNKKICDEILKSFDYPPYQFGNYNYAIVDCLRDTFEKWQREKFIIIEIRWEHFYHVLQNKDKNQILVILDIFQEYKLEFLDLDIKITLEL